jgi:spore germination protein YaaH
MDHRRPTRQTGQMGSGRRTAMAGPAEARDRGRRGRSVVVLAVVVVLVAGILMLSRALAGEPLGVTGRGAEPAASIPSAAPPLPGHEVYGFVPYWEIDDTIAAHLRATDATTIALFSVTHDRTGGLAATQTGYRRLTGPIGRRIISDAHKAGRRVDLTWTSFGRAKNTKLFDDETLQRTVIASILELRTELDVDGIAVDVEDIADEDIPAYGAFVGRLRTALHESAPDATVTATTGAGRQGAALALAAHLAGADRIFLMGYDYRIASSPPGASAPLSRGDGGERSLAWSLDLYAAAGVPVQRTLLGLPLYGMAWPSDDDAIGGGSTGKGAAWVPRRNLAAIGDRDVRAIYDPVENVQFLAVPDGDAWQAVYYDTPRSLAPKLALANDRGLAGAGFWAIGYERGLPDYTNLIEDFRAGRSMAGLVRGG